MSVAKCRCGLTISLNKPLSRCPNCKRWFLLELIKFADPDNENDPIEVELLITRKHGTIYFSAGVKNDERA